MVFKDYYKILGLETNKVTTDEIRNAYREKAKKYHPDKNAGNAEIEDIFKDINEAYKILSNSRTKRKYDYNWNKYVGRKTQKTTQKQKKTLKETIIEMLFGEVSKKKAKKVEDAKYGEDINTSVDISIEQAFFGANKKLKFRTVQGKETTFNFKVPAGVRNHDKIKIPGQGQQGKNGGKNGDLVISINIKDNNNLKLVGSDLFLELPIKVWEAALGTTKKIDVLREEIQIVIPKCTSSGDKLTIQGKGYSNGKGERGKLNIITKIVLSKEELAKEIKIFEMLKKAESQNKVMNSKVK